MSDYAAGYFANLPGFPLCIPLMYSEPVTMLPRLEDMTDEQVAPFLQAARDLLAYADDKQTKRNVDRKAIEWAHGVIARMNTARGLL